MEIKIFKDILKIRKMKKILREKNLKYCIGNKKYLNILRIIKFKKYQRIGIKIFILTSLIFR